MDDNGRLADQMPQTIGRYQVQENVGYGAMGAVYKAFDPLIKRTLAIKTIRLDIPRQSPQYRSFIDRFYHEARISGTLSHPNIVTLFDIGEESGLPYLAMEFVEGETLSSLLEKGLRFKPEKVIGLVSQVAAAVDYAHSKGVIHRDIKPSNLILSEGDRIKVTDFGIAKLIDAEMTQSGTLLGTPSYMSPEQAMGEKLDGRSDIFSLGVCAFEMLSGEQPFPGNNVTSILYKLVHVEPIEPANLEMHGLVPQKWHEVFGKVLAKRPDDRYQTATEFVQDLEYCLGAWFGAAMDAPIPEPPSLEHAEPMELDPIEQTVSMAVPNVGEPPAAAPAAEPTLRMPAPAAEGTVMMAAPIPPPAPVPADEATALMPVTSVGKVSAPKVEIEGTVMMAAPPLRLAPVTPPPPAPAPTAPPPNGGDLDGTVVMSVPVIPAPVTPPPADGTVVMFAPVLPPRVAPIAEEGAPAIKPLRPPAARADAGAPPASKKKGSVLVVAGGVGLLLVTGIAVLAFFWLQQRRAPTESAPPATPAPVTTIAAAPEPVATPQPPPTLRGTLHVESVPPGATVTMDGETLGVTPLDVSELAMGSHEVRVELKGHQPETQAFELTPDQPTAELEWTLKRATPDQGTADITSTPPGALVRIDGISAGQTPVRNQRLRAGSHSVEVTADGYERWTGNLTVREGRRTPLEVSLKPIPKAVPTPAPDVVDPNRVYSRTEVDKEPVRISAVSATYPFKALKGKKELSVGGTFVVNEKGEVSDLQIEQSGGAQVDQAVMAAVAKWKYSPGERKGTKVKVRMAFLHTFKGN